jgi:hypothetical protein
MTDRYQQHGAFSWNELMTTDAEAAKQFYTKLLGWTTEDMQIEGQLGGMTYTVVKSGGEEVGGIMPLPPQARGTPLIGRLMSPWMTSIPRQNVLRS